MGSIPIVASHIEPESAWLIWSCPPFAGQVVADQRLSPKAPYAARSSASLRTPPMMPPSILFIM